MQQFTEIKSIRFSKSQIESLDKLESFNVNIGQFIRDAIKEKIQRNWENIKEIKIKGSCPF